MILYSTIEFSDILSRCASQAGIKTRLTPHSFRRGCATWFSSNGMTDAKRHTGGSPRMPICVSKSGLICVFVCFIVVSILAKICDLSNKILIYGDRFSLNFHYPMNFLCLIQIYSYLCFSSCSVSKWLALNLIRFLKWKLYKESIVLPYSIVDWKKLLSIYSVCQFLTIFLFFSYYRSGSQWIRCHTLAVMTVIVGHLYFSQILFLWNRCSSL